MTEERIIKDYVEKSHMTSLYLTKIPATATNLRMIMEIEKCCENRLKLYKLLQAATNDCELYSTAWMLQVVNAISKENLPYLALLNSEKVRELRDNAAVKEPKDFDDGEGQAEAKEQKECKTVEAEGKELDGYKPTEDVIIQAFEDDEVGHSFCAFMVINNTDLKRLFLKLETQWLHVKFSLNVPDKSIPAFLTVYNMKPEEASTEEIQNEKESLSFYELDWDNLPVIFKVPFQEAPHMIAKKELVLKDGIMFLPSEWKYLSPLISHVARKAWARRIEAIQEHYTFNPDRDERVNLYVLKPFIPEMISLLHYCGGASEGVLTVTSIENHAYYLFPLCSSVLYSWLKEKSHLKHLARQQFTLFLKHAGMSVQDCMTFIKREFTKRITEEEFVKEKYDYFFRHFLGQVGSKIDYAAQSCEQIMETNVPCKGQEHGCPYVHADEKALTRMLEERAIDPTTINEILHHKREKQYRQACRLYFEDKTDHPLDCVESPNGYYSCALDKIEDIEDLCSKQ